MLKKLALVLLACLLVFGLMVSCDDGSGNTTPTPNPNPVVEYCDLCGNAKPGHVAGGDCYCINCDESWGDCTCLSRHWVLTVVQDGSTGAPTIAQNQLETGKGYITGFYFNTIKDAPRGTKIEVTIFAELTDDAIDQGWGDCGSVGGGSMTNDTDRRVNIVPVAAANLPSDGKFTFEVAIEDLWRVNEFENASYASVNVWGGVEVAKVMLVIPKTPSTANVDPQVKDFYITLVAQQFLDEGTVVPVTVAPRHNMSKGAITIKYDGSTTVPAAAGTYPVTFDVAAATGFNAKAGLSAGTLDVKNERPSAASLASFLTITGITVAGLDTELVPGALVPTGPLDKYFEWVSGANIPSWFLNPDNSYSLRVDATDGNYGVKLDIPFAEGDVINVVGRFAADTSGQVLVNSGDWNVIGAGSGTAVDWGVAEGGSFDITGTFQASQVDNVRIMANSVAAGSSYFYIDSITITR